MAVESSYKYLDPTALSRLKNMSLAARLVVEGFLSIHGMGWYHRTCLLTCPREAI